MIAMIVGCTGAGVPPRRDEPPKIAAREALVRSAPPRFDYPPARRSTDADTKFGVTVLDPYRWLESDTEGEVRDRHLQVNRASTASHQA